MQYDLCRHIKTNGLQCQSPALTDGPWCYFHSRLYQSHQAFRYTPQTRGYLVPGQHIELCVLEDRESVQSALSVVINALATGKLETRRATALLYGLQLAGSNAARISDPIRRDVVRTVQSTPEGLDIAEPGAVLEDPPFFDDSDEDEDEEAEDMKRHYELMTWADNQFGAKRRRQDSPSIDAADEIKKVAP
jgi:hypothetical protein